MIISVLLMLCMFKVSSTNCPTADASKNIITTNRFTFNGYSSTVITRVVKGKTTQNLYYYLTISNPEYSGFRKSDKDDVRLWDKVYQMAP